MNQLRINTTFQQSHQVGRSSRHEIPITDLRVQMVMGLMDSDIARNLSLSDLARIVNLSPWHLCHLFSGQTGMPPLHYFRVLRMEEARKLLETTFLSVKQVMAEVGIRDESHFVRDFKTHHGMYPSELRMLSHRS